MFRLLDYRRLSMVPYTYQGTHDTYPGKYAASTPKLDPAVLVPYLTSQRAPWHVPTLSVSEYPPYLLARLVNSLDHVTEGRMG